MVAVGGEGLRSGRVCSRWGGQTACEEARRAAVAGEAEVCNVVCRGWGVGGGTAPGCLHGLVESALTPRPARLTLIVNLDHTVCGECDTAPPTDFFAKLCLEAAAPQAVSLKAGPQVLVCAPRVMSLRM